MLGPALAVADKTLRAEIAAMKSLIGAGRALTIRTGADCELHLALGDRVWLDDAGAITPAGRARGAHVANFPAGSVYTTVLEAKTHGRLHLASPSGGAGGATLHFEHGAVVEITGAAEADAIRELLDDHDANAGRVSHVGIGLNPHLTRAIGWTLVDEHVRGRCFIALGENRHLGGQNESSLNVDYAISGATLLVDERVVIDRGVVR